MRRVCIFRTEAQGDGALGKLPPEQREESLTAQFNSRLRVQVGVKGGCCYHFARQENSFASSNAHSKAQAAATAGTSLWTDMILVLFFETLPTSSQATALT